MAAAIVTTSGSGEDRRGFMRCDMAISFLGPGAHGPNAPLIVQAIAKFRCGGREP